jgi:hypothetical protein
MHAVSADIPALVNEYYRLLGAGDIGGLVGLYGTDAEIVRYDGVARTPDEIASFFRLVLAKYPGFSLRSVDQLTDTDDVLMWDALVDTEAGVLQTVDVVVLDDAGSIRRHIPGVRGYWGA